MALYSDEDRILAITALVLEGQLVTENEVEFIAFVRDCSTEELLVSRAFRRIKPAPPIDWPAIVRHFTGWSEERAEAAIVAAAHAGYFEVGIVPAPAPS